MVGKEVIIAIQHFFQIGRMLREINATFITIIPKVLEADSFKDYRPISLCNLLYKFITKVLANGLKMVIRLLVRCNQMAFIEGRSIVDNILVCHEVVRGFKRSNHSPTVIMKIDLKKAYDSVSWEFIEKTIEKMNFPHQFIGWVMACITSPKFSVMVNGSPAGFFRAHEASGKVI